jgi:very-short-patch-repair endonuclease
MSRRADRSDARALAEIQHGAILLDQLDARGLGPNIRHRMIEAGELCRLPWRGAFGFVDLAEPWTEAAGFCLAVPAGALSDRAAARFHGWDGAPDMFFEATIRRTGTQRHPLIHRRNDLLALDVETIGVIRVTNATRTLVDYAAWVCTDDTEFALEHALRSGATSVPRLRWRAHGMNQKGRQGPAELGVVLDQRPENAPPTESYAETFAVQRLRRSGVELPSRQVRVRLPSGGSVRLDFAYIDDLVFVEIDGWATHGDLRSFRLDRRHRNELVSVGWRPLTMTWSELNDPGWVAHHVRATLAQARAGLRRSS